MIRFVYLAGCQAKWRALPSCTSNGSLRERGKVTMMYYLKQLQQSSSTDYVYLSLNELSRRKTLSDEEVRRLEQAGHVAFFSLTAEGLCPGFQV